MNIALCFDRVSWDAQLLEARKMKGKATKVRRLKTSREKVEASGNVFADLGFQDAEERL